MIISSATGTFRRSYQGAILANYAQDCGNPFADALELPQPCARTFNMYLVINKFWAWKRSSKYLFNKYINTIYDIVSTPIRNSSANRDVLRGINVSRTHP